MELVTAKTGSGHITPKQDSAFFRAMAGVNNGYFQKVTPTISVASATSVTIGEIELLVQGRRMLVEPGTTDTVSITGATGVSGQSRYDLICAKIMNGQTQSGSWYIVQGEASSSPVVPTYTQGDLDNGDSVGLYAVFKLLVGSTSIESAELVANPIPMIEDKETLLWTNPNASTSFAPQTITLSETSANFDYLVCYWRGTINISRYGIGRSIGRDNNRFQLHNTRVQPDSSIAVDFIGRQGEISGTSVVWGHALYCSINRNGTQGLADADQFLIPEKIVGVKE